MTNEQISEQVLDYWFAIEFLGQDSYESSTEKAEIERGMKSFYRATEDEKKRRKQIKVFDILRDNVDIPNLINTRAKEFGMKTWGNLTFYVGKVKRQTCIEALAKQMHAPLQQQERNNEEIPILSFQCSNTGKYLDHSLSLSTIIWALSQITENGGTCLSDVLSSQQYDKSLKELEKRLFHQKSASGLGETFDDSERSQRDALSLANRDANETQEDPDERDSSDTQEVQLSDYFAEIPAEFITSAKISEIVTIVQDTYGKYLGVDSIKQTNGIKYQLFKDEAAKDRYYDDNYSGLSHDFFSADLKMIRDSISNRADNYQYGMLSDLISYICAPYERNKERERIDFVNPRDKKQFIKQLLDILNARNSPLGKWPSRHKPALMQQIAINIAISSKESGVLGKKGNIFSVNGPPGTGKTTLLKEVIANHVVEKARLLSKYDSPDDAFTGVSFAHGPLEDGSYVKFVPKWYRFNNDRIADYEVLVTSCNNAAVENITKELPLEKGIIDNLKPNTDEEHPDSAEMTKRLDEIRKIFSASETEKRAELYKKDPSRHGEYPEVYFTGYAKKLLGSEKMDANTWGLVAAPLGRQDNISSYYFDVIKPLIEDFLFSNSDITNRLPNYHQARIVFREQLEKVQNMRNALGQYGDAVTKAILMVEKSKEIAQRNKIEIERISLKKSEVNEEEEKLQRFAAEQQNKLKEEASICEEINQKIYTHNIKIGDLSGRAEALTKQAEEIRGSISIITKLFRRRKYKTILSQAQEYLDQVTPIQAKIAEENELAAQLKIKHQKACNRKTFAKEQLRDAQCKEGNLRKQEDKLNARIQQLCSEIKKSQAEAETACRQRDKILQQFQEEGEMKTGIVLDEAFVERVLSADKTITTEAHTENPWMTEEYNLEREKLFYYALQLSKEFLLSSTSCRTNLRILGQYWGLRLESEKEKILFHPKDREAMMGSLLTTLFLLTPVVSSTFASVARLLKDVKAPGTLGTLIIDEAGQAQPQMALGALFRARNSIIVGDPKQVEPVVPDDLKLLKTVYSESLYRNYKDKSLSVQACADVLNPFGTFYENGTNEPEWVGCPLLVHRRCIAPMYEISNQISYNGIMKQKTKMPSIETAQGFLYQKSQWINIAGNERGSGNHYVPKQGERVCQMVGEAFLKSERPDLYIISPFSSVIQEIKNELRRYAKKHHENQSMNSPFFEDWLHDNIGTVHRFQGKEAQEVIFLLGCDEMVKNKYAVTGFVNSNLVNVAVTRAKYRLYIVGDFKVWRNNPFIQTAKSVIDTLALKNIAELENIG